MRSHRVPNWPDPNSTGRFDKSKLTTQQLGATSTQVQGAQRACNHLLLNAATARAPPRCSRRKRRGCSSHGAYAPTASRTFATLAATAAYPTLPRSESIRARRSSRPQTRRAGDTGLPTFLRTPPTTPGRGRTRADHEDGDAEWKLTSMRRPPSAGASVLIVASCASAIARTMERPSPRPSAPLVRVASSRWNG
jgi:hypothetical protein